MKPTSQMNISYKEKVSYKINEKNIIIAIEDDWLLAAKTGKADDLLDINNVLETNLFSYISEDSTRMYYDVIFQKCRLFNKNHNIAYRCDSPTHKRFMEMHIHPLSNGHLSILNYLKKEELFNNPIHITEKSIHTIKNPIKRCSICNDLKLKEKTEWVHPDLLAKEKEQHFFVIHSICPKCQNRNWRAL